MTMLADIVAGRDAVVALEHPGKAENIRIAGRERRFSGGAAMLGHQLRRFAQPAVGKKLLWGAPGLLSEDAAEITAVEVELPRQIRDGNVSHIFRFDEGFRCLHIPLRPIRRRGAALRRDSSSYIRAAEGQAPVRPPVRCTPTWRRKAAPACGRERISFLQNGGQGHSAFKTDPDIPPGIGRFAS